MNETEIAALYPEVIDSLEMLDPSAVLNRLNYCWRQMAEIKYNPDSDQVTIKIRYRDRTYIILDNCSTVRLVEENSPKTNLRIGRYLFEVIVECSGDFRFQDNYQLYFSLLST